MSSLIISFNTLSTRRIITSIIAALAAFLAYTCVYAFRKPFTLIQFDQRYWDIGYQTLLILAQVGGYMVSKFAGIKFISEMGVRGRLVSAVFLVTIAWLCLLGFALSPDWLGLCCLFVNGFALGFLWGIIFSYIEGRTTTDFIGACMAVSFIFAGGFTRTVGKWVLMESRFTDKWMPFITGLLFLIPLIGLLVLLDRLPPPDAQDISNREKRLPMDETARNGLIKFMGIGLIVIIACYVVLTVMRDLRDNYMSVIWEELGYSDNYTIFTQTESLTSVIILLVMAMIVFIRHNFSAFRTIHFLIIAGFLIAFLSSFCFSRGMISGFGWMQMVSIGLYMGYIPFNCIFFERFIAAFKIHGTVGFLMYFADSFGYMGSVGVMLYKEFFSADLQWTSFYSEAVQATSIFGIAGSIFSIYFFNNKYRWLKKKQLL